MQISQPNCEQIHEYRVVPNACFAYTHALLGPHLFRRCHMAFFLLYKGAEIASLTRLGYSDGVFQECGVEQKAFDFPTFSHTRSLMFP